MNRWLDVVRAIKRPGAFAEHPLGCSYRAFITAFGRETPRSADGMAAGSARAASAAQVELGPGRLGTRCCCSCSSGCCCCGSPTGSCSRCCSNCRYGPRGSSLSAATSQSVLDAPPPVAAAKSVPSSVLPPRPVHSGGTYARSAACFCAPAAAHVGKCASPGSPSHPTESSM